MNEQEEFIRHIPPQVEYAILVLPDGPDKSKLVSLRCPTYGFIVDKLVENENRIIEKKLALRFK